MIGWRSRCSIARLILFTAFANLNTWTELDRLSELHHPAPHLRHAGNVGYGQTTPHTEFDVAWRAVICC